MTEPAAPPEFLLRTLGTCELREIDRAGVSHSRLLGAGKPLALLAFCSCAREREHSRDSLATLLWGDSDTIRARQSLRQALWRLRRIIGEHLRTRDDAVLRVEASVATDRDHFLDAARGGDAVAALESYSGPFLAGLTVPGGDEFDDWAAAERRRLEEALVRVVEPHARELARSGRPSATRELVDRLIEVAPDNMDAHRVTVLALLESGNVAEARRAADALESVVQSLGGRAPVAVEGLIARARNLDASTMVESSETFKLDLVGRERIFGSVVGAWHRACGGETQIVLLAGMSGIGKSRLLAAISRRCEGRHTLTATIRANPGEHDVAFGFAAAIARALAALPGAAGVSGETARELIALDPALSSRFAASPSTVEGGEAVRRRALAFVDILEAISEQNSLALCLDDLQWADAASCQLLAMACGRLSSLRILIVATTRGSHSPIFDQRTVITHALLPLSRDDVVDAIRSSGSWPETPDANRFIESLIAVSEGIPLSVVERLAFARDRRLLTLHNGVWESNSWDAASIAIAVESPLDHRLNACPDAECAVLLAFAVAGTPLTESILLDTVNALARATSVTLKEEARSLDRTSVLAALSSLEVKGLIVRIGDGWLPSHDVVSERMLRGASPEKQRDCHLALAQALSISVAPESTARAVRHFLLGDNDGEAGREFARAVSEARARGDRRPVREMLFELTGERITEARMRAVLRNVPIRHRFIALGARLTVAAAVLVAVAVSLMSFYYFRLPVLMIAQSASRSAASSSHYTTALDVVDYGNDVRRLSPSIVVATGNNGRQAGSPTEVHVRSLSRQTRIVAGGSAAVINGEASFNRLRFVSTDSTSTFRFEAAGFRSVELTAARTTTDVSNTRLKLVGGTVNGRAVDTATKRISVARGGKIAGEINLEYTSAWVSASVWLSMTPTWGDHRKVGRELTPLITPVRNELARVPIELLAPQRQGLYWILFLIAAEPSGQYGVSQTNWTVERPVWNDGNDLASLPDSTIRLANMHGFAMTPIAMPLNWATGFPCTPVDPRRSAVRIKHCPLRSVFLGIEVVVH